MDEDLIQADEITVSDESFDRNSSYDLVETVQLTKPMGIRLQKYSMKVVYVDDACAQLNKVALGDRLIAMNGKPVPNLEALNVALSDPSSRAMVTFRRKAFSQCLLRYTTVETLTVKKDPRVMRAVDVYAILLSVRDLNDDLSYSGSLDGLLGLKISYDAKDRIVVVGTVRDSLASVHFRAHDIIREVNGHPVASKTMVQFWIMDGLEREGHVRVVVEAAIGVGTCHYDIEVPPDVHSLARRQLRQRAKIIKQMPQPQSILRSATTEAPERHVVVAGRKYEVEIPSDYDESTLIRVKGQGSSH